MGIRTAHIVVTVLQLKDTTPTVSGRTKLTPLLLQRTSLERFLQ
jgi:hypothetical protein